MKVVHLCNNLWWGAGKAARRLHEGLLRVGVDSSMVVRDAKDASAPGVFELERPRGVARRVERALYSRWVRRALQPHAGRRPAGADLFVDDRVLPRLGDHPRVRAADLVHLHWVGTSGHSERFFADLGDKPVVWTLHDMLPFTGGCVYAGSCTRYRERCGACPQLGSTRDADLSRAIWQRKARAYLRRSAGAQPSCVTTPSRWLASQARESRLMQRCRVEVIAYGLDLAVFQPEERERCRQQLGVPADAFVVLAGSLDARTTRKGFVHLVRALELLATGPAPRPLALLTFGGSWSSVALPATVRVVSLGQVSDEHRMACAYAAADVTALPSLEDNLPLVMLESMACGTPVVGFETGGVPDAVHDGVNGLVVPRGDSAALADALRRLWHDPARTRELGRAAREHALVAFDLESRARDFQTLYRSLLDG